MDASLATTEFGISHTDPLHSGTVYAGAANGVFKSTDGETTWVAANTGLPAANSIFTLAMTPPATPSIPSIASLIAKIANLNLDPGEDNALTAKLRVAEASLLRENAIAAANQLHAFVNHVHAMERSGRLDSATAKVLAAAAQAIIDAI